MYGVQPPHHCPYFLFNNRFVKKDDEKYSLYHLYSPYKCLFFIENSQKYHGYKYVIILYGLHISYHGYQLRLEYDSATTCYQCSYLIEVAIAVN